MVATGRIATMFSNTGVAVNRFCSNTVRIASVFRVISATFAFVYLANAHYRQTNNSGAQ